MNPFIPMRSIPPLTIRKRLASAERLGHGRLGDAEQSCNRTAAIPNSRTAQ